MPSIIEMLESVSDTAAVRTGRAFLFSFLKNAGDKVKSSHPK